MSKQNEIVWSESMPAIMLRVRCIADISTLKEQIAKKLKHVYTLPSSLVAYGGWMEYPRVELHATGENKFEPFIKFFASEKHRDAERFTYQKMVRYLNAHTEWPQHEKDLFINHVRSHIPAEVLFTKNGNESVQVYLDGPNSCMSHSTDEYSSTPHHPACVYDLTKGDVCVVYMKKDGKVTARAMCRPSKKVYGRVYGDYQVLESSLKRMGYKNDYKLFVGSLLPYIPKGHGFVFPYIDGLNYVSILSNHKQVVLHNRYNADDIPGLKNSIYATYEAQSQTGLTPEYEDDDEHYVYCELCDRSYHRDYMTSIERYGAVCDDCVVSEFIRCENCIEFSHMDEAVYSECFAFCSKECFDKVISICDNCEKEVDPDHTTTINDEKVCRDCVVTCDRCEANIVDGDENYQSDDAHEALCDTCFFEDDDALEKK